MSVSSSRLTNVEYLQEPLSVESVIHSGNDRPSSQNYNAYLSRQRAADAMLLSKVN